MKWQFIFFLCATNLIFSMEQILEKQNTSVSSNSKNGISVPESQYFIGEIATGNVAGIPQAIRDRATDLSKFETLRSADNVRQLLIDTTPYDPRAYLYWSMVLNVPNSDGTTLPYYSALGLYATLKAHAPARSAVDTLTPYDRNRFYKNLRESLETHGLMGDYDCLRCLLDPVIHQNGTRDHSKSVTPESLVRAQFLFAKAQLMDPRLGVKNPGDSEEYLKNVALQGDDQLAKSAIELAFGFEETKPLAITLFTSRFASREEKNILDENIKIFAQGMKQNIQTLADSAANGIALHARLCLYATVCPSQAAALELCRILKEPNSVAQTVTALTPYIRNQLYGNVRSALACGGAKGNYDCWRFLLDPAMHVDAVQSNQRKQNPPESLVQARKQTHEHLRTMLQAAEPVTAQNACAFIEEILDSKDESLIKSFLRSKALDQLDLMACKENGATISTTSYAQFLVAKTQLKHPILLEREGRKFSNDVEDYLKNAAVLEGDDFLAMKIIELAFAHEQTRSLAIFLFGLRFLNNKTKNSPESLKTFVERMKKDIQMLADSEEKSAASHQARLALYTHWHSNGTEKDQAEKYLSYLQSCVTAGIPEAMALGVNDDQVTKTKAEKIDALHRLYFNKVSTVDRKKQALDGLKKIFSEPTAMENEGFFTGFTPTTIAQLNEFFDLLTRPGACYDPELAVSVGICFHYGIAENNWQPRFKEKIEALTQTLQTRAPGEAWAHYLLSYYYYQRTRIIATSSAAYAAALQALTEMESSKAYEHPLKKLYGEPQCYQLLGGVHIQLNNLERALECYQKADERGSISASYSLANLILENASLCNGRERFDQAIACLVKAARGNTPAAMNKLRKIISGRVVLPDGYKLTTEQWIIMSTFVCAQKKLTDAEKKNAQRCEEAQKAFEEQRYEQALVILEELKEKHWQAKALLARMHLLGAGVAQSVETSASLMCSLLANKIDAVSSQEVFNLFNQICSMSTSFHLYYKLLRPLFAPQFKHSVVPGYLINSVMNSELAILRGNNETNKQAFFGSGLMKALAEHAAESDDLSYLIPLARINIERFLHAQKSGIDLSEEENTLLARPLINLGSQIMSEYRKRRGAAIFKVPYGLVKELIVSLARFEDCVQVPYFQFLHAVLLLSFTKTAKWLEPEQTICVHEAVSLLNKCKDQIPDAKYTLAAIYCEPDSKRFFTGNEAHGLFEKGEHLFKELIDKNSAEAMVEFGKLLSRTKEPEKLVQAHQLFERAANLKDSAGVFCLASIDLQQPALFKRDPCAVYQSLQSVQAPSNPLGQLIQLLRIKCGLGEKNGERASLKRDLDQFINDVMAQGMKDNSYIEDIASVISGEQLSEELFEILPTQCPDDLKSLRILANACFNIKLAVVEPTDPASYYGTAFIQLRSYEKLKDDWRTHFLLSYAFLKDTGDLTDGGINMIQKAIITGMKLAQSKQVKRCEQKLVQETIDLFCERLEEEGQEKMAQVIQNLIKTWE